MTKVVVFTREGCTFCDLSKELLEQCNIPYQTEYLQAGVVPQILVEDEMIGGYEELLAIVYDENKWNTHFGEFECPLS